MTESANQRPMRDDYEIASKDLDPRRIDLTLGAANQLRDYIAQDYLPRLMEVFPPHKKKIALHFNEEEDTLVFGRNFGVNLYDASDERNESLFTGLKLTHTADAWRLRLNSARYKHDGTPNRVATYYAIDIAKALVLKAQVETRVLTSDKEEVYGQLTGGDTPRIWRRLYQRQISNRDCLRLQGRLQQTANRCVALA